MKGLSMRSFGFLMSIALAWLLSAPVILDAAPPAKKEKPPAKPKKPAVAKPMPVFPPVLPEGTTSATDASGLPETDRDAEGRRRHRENSA